MLSVELYFLNYDFFISIFLFNFILLSNLTQSASVGVHLDINILEAIKLAMQFRNKLNVVKDVLIVFYLFLFYSFMYFSYWF